MNSSYQQFAGVYDQLMADMPYKRWLTFAEGVWAQFGKPQKIVELGSGTGNTAIPLALRGLHVTGIDLSGEMLDIAGHKWEQYGVEAEGSLQLVQQNMCHWQLNEQTDSVLSFCDSLNYIVDEDELLSVFQATYDGLKDGGTFIFDVHPISRFQQYAEEQPFVYDEDGISYMWTSSYDEDEHIIEHELAIFVLEADGRYRRIDELHIQRAYHERWLEGALRECGFQMVYIYADFEFNEPDENSQRLFFVAIK